ncbi:hypothetical protein MC885_000149 [Smutsia gigantea]|nr:hypothetical protein MC885_000149 [Smutsia gigantea]
MRAYCGPHSPFCPCLGSLPAGGPRTTPAAQNPGNWKPAKPFSCPVVLGRRVLKTQELLSWDATLKSWYHLYLLEGRVLPVFCDMDATEGSWLLVFQRRQDGSMDFSHSWPSYKSGFRSQESIFWLGNENLPQFTCQGKDLQVELRDFKSNHTFAHCETFCLLEKQVTNS